MALSNDDVQYIKTVLTSMKTKQQNMLAKPESIHFPLTTEDLRFGIQRIDRILDEL